MEIKINWDIAQGSVDTKDMKLVCVPARGKRSMSRFELDADLCISDSFNFAIAQIHTGDVESSNALCKEIVRRFNEFPEDLKL